MQKNGQKNNLCMNGSQVARVLLKKLSKRYATQISDVKFIKFIHYVESS